MKDIPGRAVQPGMRSPALNQPHRSKKPLRMVCAEPANSQHVESLIMTAKTYSPDEILEARGKLTHLEAADIDDVTWLARIATLLDSPVSDGNAIVAREQTTILKYRAMGWEPGDVSELANIAAEPKTQQHNVPTDERKSR